MNILSFVSNRLFVLAAVAFFGAGITTANATEPCDDFGECKVLVEINSTDGDAGFHFLMDGDDLRWAGMFNPHGRKIFSYHTRRELRSQTLTETFAESAEPLCWFDPEEDPEDVVTLEEFLGRWKTGTYHFLGISAGWEISSGASPLGFDLPAAPAEVEYESEMDGDDIEGEISWEPGDDLGNCAERWDEEDEEEGDDPNVPNLDDILHLLDEDPEDVEVFAWEVVLEPDFEDEDPNSVLNNMKYVVRIPGDGCDEDEKVDGECVEFEAEVPDDYLETLPENTPAKAEVGAIGLEDNATFTEIDEICLNDSLFPDDYVEGVNEDGEDTLFNGCGFEVEEDGD